MLSQIKNKIQKYIDNHCSFWYYEIHWKWALLRLIKKKISEWILYKWNKDIDFIKQLLCIQEIWEEEIIFAYEHKVLIKWQENNSLILCGKDWQPIYCGKKIIIK